LTTDDWRLTTSNPWGTQEPIRNRTAVSAKARLRGRRLLRASGRHDDSLLNRWHIRSAEPLFDLVHFVVRSCLKVCAGQQLHREWIIRVFLELRDRVLPPALCCQQGACCTVIRTLNDQVAAAGRHGLKRVERFLRQFLITGMRGSNRAISQNAG